MWKILFVESHDELKGFSRLSLNEFGDSYVKYTSRCVHNTNEYKYKGPSNHFTYLI